MQQQKRNKFIPGYWVLILIQIFFVGSVEAQSFDNARKLAFGGHREQAREICRLLLSQEFDSDVALLFGRTYAWDGKYDSARIIFNEVRAKMPDNLEVLGALADVEYWSDNYPKAIEYCDLALGKVPGDEDYILKKARILNSSGSPKEAATVLENYIKLYPSHSEVFQKLQEYRLDVMKNTVQLSYTYDYFSDSFNRDPWQIAALSYGRKTRLGSVIVRANIAQRYGQTGYQFEVDAYPKISENNYGYLNYGYSPSSVFPENRAGFEWYHNFPKSFEGSVGMRMLFFGNSSVNIFTATVGKYSGNYWFSLRSFVTPSSDGTSVSGLLQIRRYFSDPENYIGMRVGYGVSPDDNRNLIDSGQKLTLKTRSLRLEYNHIFNHIWIFKTGAVYGLEELSQKKYSGYYTLDISISYLF